MQDEKAELTAHYLNQDAGCLLCRVQGRLDALSAPDLTNVLTEALAVPGIAKLTVDLSAATFIDSAALAVLVRIRKTCLSDRVELVLVRPDTEDAMRIFRLTMFDQVFTMVPSGRGHSA